MPDGWSDYYVLIGTAAATLIGLMFVVSTLMTGHEPHEVERGKKIYTSPVVWQFAGALAISGAALIPTITAPAFAIFAAAVGLVGTILSTWISVRIGRSNAPASTRIFDFWWYGIAAAVSYAVLLAAAVASFEKQWWSLTALSLAVMALLLVAIHNAWDLVTFLAPRTKGEPTAASAEENMPPAP